MKEMMPRQIDSKTMKVLRADKKKARAYAADYVREEMSRMWTRMEKVNKKFLIL